MVFAGGADYWVSNERKFCDFCKCWIADNKPSIAFHDGGKRHKANVAKRITELSKQSIKDEKAKQKVDQQIRQMEDAAMRAYAADISRGADMTSQAINAFAALHESSEEASVKTTGHIPGPSALPTRAIDPLMPPIDVLEEEEREKRERMKRKGEVKSWTNETENTQSMWCEAKSDDGHTYYWNVKTGDTKWNVPKEGYMTLEEYNRINKLAEAQQELQLHKESMFMRGNADEIVARYQREKLKERRPKPTPAEVKEVEEEKASYKTYEEPGWSAKPLGEWTTVSQTETKAIDLQLPETSHQYLYVPSVEPEPPVKKFKEKTITSLPLDDESSNTLNTFKKRKTAIKRNVRQRNDDD